MDLIQYLPHFQVVAVLINGLLVLIVMPLRRSIEELQHSDDRLASRVHGLEIKLAENYVQRNEIYDQLAESNRRLERIEQTLLHRIDVISANG
jgi:uncharacterized coiled-coil protein SlyX